MKNQFLTDIRDLASSLYRNQEKSEELIGIFKVYHPVYEFPVKMVINHHDPSYRLIEKYMDKLICGYESRDRIHDSSIWIQNKDQLLDLLGLNGLAYEISNLFYKDLQEAGHFTETPFGLLPQTISKQSILLNSKVTSTQHQAVKLFDQLNLKLLPDEFYELSSFSITKDSLDFAETRNSLFFDPVDHASNPDNLSIINDSIRAAAYTGSEQKLFGLPTGFKMMELGENPSIDFAFFPYYLAVFNDSRKPKTAAVLVFRVFDVDTGKEIETMSSRFNTDPKYQPARDRVRSVLLNKRKVDGEINPIIRSSSYMSDGELNPGYSIDQFGNIHWKLRDDDLAEFMGLNEESTYKKWLGPYLVKSPVIPLNGKLFGHLLFCDLTSDQEKLLRSRTQSRQERIQLYQQYKEHSS